MIIEVRGKRYKDAASAAKHLKVTKSAIYSALHRGTIDNVGRGKGVHGHKHITKVVPVIVANKSFPSIKSLSEFIGRHPANVRRALMSGPSARHRLEAQVIHATIAGEQKNNKRST